MNGMMMKTEKGTKRKTLDDMGPMEKGHRSQSASDFVHFYNSVRKTGAVENQVTNKDILKFSKLFEDEITLDNMTRGQLVAICRLLELTPIGTNAFLRFQIEMQLRKLKADDVIIVKEGVEQMTVGELQVACKERGMRALGITQEKLIKQLKQWIELSTNEKVPPSLLLLSRTLVLHSPSLPEKAIEASISALPEAVATGAKAKIGEREGKIENVTRLEIIKQEQAKIEEEQREQEQNAELKKKKAEEEALKKEKLAQQALEKAIEEQSLGVPPPSPPTTESVVREATSILRRATVSQEGEVSLSSEESNPITFIETVQTTTDDIHVGRAEVIQESAPKTAKKSLLEQELSVEDLKALRSAIETITLEKGKTYIGEHEVLSELKQEMVDYDEDLGEMKEVAESTGRKNLKQTKGAARLFKKVNNMLGKADHVVSQLKMREEKLRGDIDSLGKVGESSEDQEEHLVTVQDLLGAVKGLQEVPDSKMLERISEVVASMDEDSDGIVKLEHVNKVIEILGSDNVELSGKQVKQIIDLIGKEEMLEVESRIEKILGKMPVMEIKSDAPKQAEIPVIEDITEKVGDEELKDMAVEMNTDKVEDHIAEMFSRPVGEKKEETKVETVIEPEEENVQIMSRFIEDNSVKDVNESIKDKEEDPVKVPQKNGSK
jgi:LETM1 and EF-hand domain-containing protein 1